jgi:hypothetical protein
MTDYLYEGPAVLAINDAEIDVYARLAVLRSQGVDDTTWWANLAFHPLRPPTEDTPCTLRLPGGWKWNGRIPAGATCMLGNSPPPARVQPPATDTTMIPTAELDHLRAEIARLRADVAEKTAEVDDKSDVGHVVAMAWQERADQAEQEVAENDGVIKALRRQRDDAEAAVARVRALHSETPHRPGYCYCANPCPCRTIQALDQQEADRG